jgi:hypothetical protein
VVTRLDEFAPVWQFREVHRTRVAASAEQAYRAIKDVSADEILFYRTLTWIRRLGRPLPQSILNAPPHAPLLDVAIRGGFLLLADQPGREVVVGTVVIAPRGAVRPSTPEQYRALGGPGYAKATMNFLITESESGCAVTTETRVHATDARSWRRFGLYWLAIYPGSALIRRMWLRAIKRRAER